MMISLVLMMTVVEEEPFFEELNYTMNGTYRYYIVTTASTRTSVLEYLYSTSMVYGRNVRKSYCLTVLRKVLRE